MRTSDGAREQLAAVGGPELEFHLEVRQGAAGAEVLLADGRRVDAAQPRLQPLLPPAPRVTRSAQVGNRNRDDAPHAR